jgi:signal transduction histidine kinase
MNTTAEEQEMLKLRTEELISKTEELKQTSNSLLESNNELKLKTEELARTHADLFESNHQLASANKQLLATNKRFAETNRRFAQVNEELLAANKDLARVSKELALANEQMKSQEQISKDFINIAAHELRTPTQAITGYSELLQILFEQEAEEEKQVIVGDEDGVSNSNNSKEHDSEKKKALEAIIRNASRLGKLAKGILDITKIESNTLILDKQRFSLTEKIRDAIADVITNQMRKDASKNKNIKINFESKEGEGRENDIFIQADKIRISQVVSNLLENAIKFTKEGGPIIITADVSTAKIAETEGRQRAGEEEEEEAVVVIKVKDTGTGIDASILPRLFTKFATSSSEGIGLGLYISKSIVESHGGKMWAENNLDGKGATFAFTLPCLIN